MVISNKDLKIETLYRVRYRIIDTFVSVEGLLTRFVHDPGDGPVHNIVLKDVVQYGTTTNKVLGTYKELLIYSKDIETCNHISFDNEIIQYQVKIDPYINFKYGFPKKGWCKKPTKELIERIKSYKSQAISPEEKSGGIVWVDSSYWYVDNFSSYPELDMEYLLPYLNNFIKSGFYEPPMGCRPVFYPQDINVTDYLETKSLKIPTIIVELIQIKSRTKNY